MHDDADGVCSREKLIRRIFSGPSERVAGAYRGSKWSQDSGESAIVGRRGLEMREFAQMTDTNVHQCRIGPSSPTLSAERGARVHTRK